MTGPERPTRVRRSLGLLFVVALVGCGSSSAGEVAKDPTSGATPTSALSTSSAYAAQTVPSDLPEATVPAPTSPMSDSGRFVLPAVGEAAAVSADNGEPLWIVRHLDGSVSVFEAVVPVPPEFPNSPTGFSMLVVWSPSERAFVAPLVWDEWGRAAWEVNFDSAASPAPRSRDLVPRQAVVDTDEVVVGDGSLPVASGAPSLPPPAMGDAIERALLPPLTELPPVLNDGWFHVNATLVRHSETYRVCSGEYAFNVDPQPCSDAALLAPISGGPTVDRDSVTWFGGPLLIHVVDGRIHDLVPLGGTAGTSPPSATSTSPFARP